MNTILYIDDDKSNLEQFASTFNTSFQVETLANPLDSIEVINRVKPDGVLIDIHMPIKDGFQVLEDIKSQGLDQNRAFFFYSVDKTDDYKTNAFEFGIDDYLTRDMSPSEIVARITRRIKEVTKDPKEVIFEDIKFCTNRFAAFHNGEELDLTAIEYKILFYMVSHQNQIVERERVINYIWGDVNVLPKTLNTHLSNLRQKLKDTRAEVTSIRNCGLKLIIRHGNS